MAASTGYAFCATILSRDLLSIRDVVLHFKAGLHHCDPGMPKINFTAMRLRSMSAFLATEDLAGSEKIVFNQSCIHSLHPRKVELALVKQTALCSHVTVASRDCKRHGTPNCHGRCASTLFPHQSTHNIEGPPATMSKWIPTRHGKYGSGDTVKDMGIFDYLGR